MFEAHTLLVGVILVDFMLLASSRMSTCIRQAAIQGLLLGLLALAEHAGWEAPGRVWLLAVSIGVGIFFRGSCAGPAQAM
jgi:hypothetical protein